MPELAVLGVFIPTFLFISITPGMCMTLAMTLGMSIGVRRTIWMMLGEVIGVALVAIAAVMGVASLVLAYPAALQWLKWLGGVYLVYLGLRMGWASARLSEQQLRHGELSPRALFLQGFITAIANPKGWAFMLALLPPFINIEQAVVPQLAVFVLIIVCSEFLSMLVYASGGKSLKLVLSRGDNVRWLNRIAGAVLTAVGIWLALS